MPQANQYKPLRMSSLSRVQTGSCLTCALPSAPVELVEDKIRELWKDRQSDKHVLVALQPFLAEHGYGMG